VRDHRRVTHLRVTIDQQRQIRSHCNDAFQESGISLLVDKPASTPDELQRIKMSIDVRKLMNAE
jgi:hypothetical protein